MKTCAACKEQKELEFFSKATSKKDGLYNYCKVCTSIRRKGKDFDTYEYRKEYFKAWQRKYRATEKAKQYDRDYRSKYHQSLSGLASKLYSGAKDRAKNNGLEFGLNVAWVIENLAPLKCQATGMTLVLDVDESFQHTYNRPSIDRIDSAKGYTEENSRIVSVIFNKAKSDGLDSHVLEMCECLINRSKSFVTEA